MKAFGNVVALFLFCNYFVNFNQVAATKVYGNFSLKFSSINSTKSLQDLIPTCKNNCINFWLMINVTVITNRDWTAQKQDIQLTNSSQNLNADFMKWNIKTPVNAVIVKAMARLSASLTSSPNRLNTFLCGWNSLSTHLPNSSSLSHFTCGQTNFSYSYTYECGERGYLGLNCDCKEESSPTVCYKCNLNGQKICCNGFSGPNCYVSPTTVASSSTSSSVSQQSLVSSTAFTTSPALLSSSVVAHTTSNQSSTTPFPVFYSNINNPYFIATLALGILILLFLIVVIVLACIICQRQREKDKLMTQMRHISLLRRKPYQNSKPDVIQNGIRVTPMNGRSSNTPDESYERLKMGASLSHDRHRKLPPLPPSNDSLSVSDISGGVYYDNPTIPEDDENEEPPVYRPVTRV